MEWTDVRYRCPVKTVSAVFCLNSCRNYQTYLNLLLVVCLWENMSIKLLMYISEVINREYPKSLLYLMQANILIK